MVKKPKADNPQACNAASVKARIKAVSFTPALLSTPDETSTCRAPVRRIASATFSGVNPPANIQGARHTRPASSCQSNANPLPPGKSAVARRTLDLQEPRRTQHSAPRRPAAARSAGAGMTPPRRGRRRRTSRRGTCRGGVEEERARHDDDDDPTATTTMTMTGADSASPPEGTASTTAPYREKGGVVVCSVVGGKLGTYEVMTIKRD